MIGFMVASEEKQIKTKHDNCRVFNMKKIIKEEGILCIQ